MKTKHWVILISVVVASIFLYMLLKEPKPIDSHKDDYDRVVAEKKAFKEKEAVILKRVDSLETSGKGKDSTIAVLKAEKKATQKEADKYATISARLAKEVRGFRGSDTSEFAHKCDSLAEQVQNFVFLYEQYKAYSDSLTTVMEKQKGDYEAALTEQKRLYGDLKRLQEGMEQISDQIYKDLQAARKTIKRERLKTKIAAILGLAAGAAAVLK